MKKTLIALAAAAVAAMAFDPQRARTHDVAFTYRMGAGFAGDVNRTHPAQVYPGLQDATNPVRKYGEGALYNTSANSFRGIIAADAHDTNTIKLAGCLVRDYPVQAASAAGNYGQQLLSDSTTAPSTGQVNFLTEGRMMVKVRGASPGALTINSTVFIFASADETGHVLGGFETAEISGKTIEVSNAKFRGPTDANGIGELEIWQ